MTAAVQLVAASVATNLSCQEARKLVTMSGIKHPIKQSSFTAACGNRKISFWEASLGIAEKERCINESVGRRYKAAERIVPKSPHKPRW